jgi:L-aspartate oxidase
MARNDNIFESEGALIIGGGVAGLFTALKLQPMPALIIAGSRAGQSGSSFWAQGGVAAAMGDDDSWESHMADTISAGAGLSDPSMSAILAREGPDRVEDLLRLGTPFDRDALGRLALGLEAAHARPRIVHVGGDRAGAVISATLAKAARAAPTITLLEGFHVTELAVEEGRVVGLFAREGNGSQVLFRARAVVLATGGLGALYAVTTNPPEARGEGLGMAARAGAVIADAEFVQFHPTAIAAGRDPAPLATEALRGAGCTLINEKGVRFMPVVHPDAELAPRDIVARAIHREISRGGKVFLDCRKLEKFAARFPTVHAAAVAAGLDPARDPLPVAPAAHYHMGGIATDARARASLDGLWACGECASSGVHGANRLASNSLLEAFVFGARAAEDVRGQLAAPLGGVLPERSPAPSAVNPPPQRLRELMSLYVGIERDDKGLRTALSGIAAVERAGGNSPSLLNMIATARLVTAAALKRRESLGAHFRSDYPQRSEAPVRSFLTLADANIIAKSATIEGERAAIA